MEILFILLFGSMIGSAVVIKHQESKHKKEMHYEKYHKEDHQKKMDIEEQLKKSKKYQI